MMLTVDGHREGADVPDLAPGLDALAELARSVLDGEGVDRGHVDLFLVDEGEMERLNQAHMGSQGPTDVLSFPLDADSDTDGSDLEIAVLNLDIPVHLGDVVICPSVAARQAPSHAGTVEAELSLLTIHGVLHLLGHDHAEPEETAVMQRREHHYLERLGFHHPEPGVGS